MATVTGMTAEKIVEITEDAVVSAAIDSATGILTLQTRGGQTLTVGSVESDDAVTNAVNAAYPVGSIFMSTIATDPATQLGVGTWQAWGTGRVPVGVDAAQTEFNLTEKTGGAKTHTLTSSEMPNHNHSYTHDHASVNTDSDNHDHNIAFQVAETTTASGAMARVTDIQDAGPGGGTTYHATSGSDTHWHSVDIPSHTGSTAYVGGGAAHNNLQPYITCYMWKRTA